MIVLPIPLFTAAVLAYLAIRAAVQGETSRMIVGLVALCAVQSAIIALNQHYGVAALAPVQPFTAAAIAVFAYLTFLANSVRPLQLMPDILHLLPPAAIAVCFWAAPAQLDLLLAAVFAGYGGVIFLRLRNGADGLPLIRLAGSDRAVFLWRCVAAALAGSALGDLAIGAAMLLGSETARPVLVSAYSAAFLLVIGLISLSETLTGPETSPEFGPETGSGTDLGERQEDSPDTAPDTASGTAPDTGPNTAPDMRGTAPHPSDDAGLLENVEKHMKWSKAYLDPDLTLRKLSRQLKIPEKHLSSSINQATGENLPRFINRFRIEHACGLMQAGTPVTHAIYASGFNTKSNFNREFLRLKGLPPSAWLAAHSSL